MGRFQHIAEVEKEGVVIADYGGAAANGVRGILCNRAPGLEETRLGVVSSIQRSIPADCRHHRQRDRHGDAPWEFLDSAEGHRYGQQKPRTGQQ